MTAEKEMEYQVSSVSGGMKNRFLKWPNGVINVKLICIPEK